MAPDRNEAGAGPKRTFPITDFVTLDTGCERILASIVLSYEIHGNKSLASKMWFGGWVASPCGWPHDDAT